MITLKTAQKVYPKRNRMINWPLSRLSEKSLEQQLDLIENTNILTSMISSLENTFPLGIVKELRDLQELEKESHLDYLFTRQ